MGNCICVNNELENASKDIPLFSFKGVTVKAKPVYIYDGDTCHIVFKFDGRLQRFKLRMEGYDSPELHPIKKGRTEESLNKEREAGQRAKERLEELIGNKIVKVALGDFDKYGRLLGKIYIEHDICVNDVMIQEKHGYEYTGGTKECHF
jgi:endonuclease YncB( thermonuclease family)